MSTELPCVEYTALEAEAPLTDTDALMLSIVRQADDDERDLRL